VRKRHILGLALTLALMAFVAKPAAACTTYTSPAYDGGAGFTCWDSFQLCSDGRGGMYYSVTDTVCVG
jgi:hypothetical protein